MKWKRCYRAVSLVGMGILSLLLVGFIFWATRPDKTDRSLEEGNPLSDFVTFSWKSNHLHFQVTTPGGADRQNQCGSCHTNSNNFPSEKWERLKRRAELGRDLWAKEIQVETRCGGCHFVPDPSELTQESWLDTMFHMQRVMERRQVSKLGSDEFEDILHYYLAFSPKHYPLLPKDPTPAASPLRFGAAVLGNPKSADSRDMPTLGRVKVTDLNRDGEPDVLFCDAQKSTVNWVRRTNGIWREEVLAEISNPGHAQVVTNQSSGHLDIIVSAMGIIGPSDAPVGKVVLLVNDGALEFRPLVLLENISRVADVEPGDFDGDGDTDFVVAAYGYIAEGEVGWLERVTDQEFRYHQIIKKAGGIDVIPTDLNGDHHLDFVALFAQEHEEISAFLNGGGGQFQERNLFKAGTPSYGLSGLSLIDLERDGDTDILFTNGDNADLATIIPRPYHGVQWLENKGNLDFAWRDLHRSYGAYSATVGDLNKDGHLDIVVTSMFNNWNDPTRASIYWLENDGRQFYIPHTIARKPTHLISAALGDLDGNGWLDIVATGMHGFPPSDRTGRVTLWKNGGVKSRWERFWEAFSE